MHKVKKIWGPTLQLGAKQVVHAHHLFIIVPVILAKIKEQMKWIIKEVNSLHL